MSGSNCGAGGRDLLDSPIFIDAVRAHPCLYDCTSQEYKDADLKTRAWEDIARLLGVEGRACKHKWKRLRDYYKTWLEKRNAQETQGGSRRVKTWVHSARMEFLRPFLTTRDCRERSSSGAAAAAATAHLSAAAPLFHPYQMDPHLLLQPLPQLQPPPAHQASNATTTAAAVAAAAAAAAAAAGGGGPGGAAGGGASAAIGDGSRSAASSCGDDEDGVGGAGGDALDDEALSESGVSNTSGPAPSAAGTGLPNGLGAGGGPGGGGLGTLGALAGGGAPSPGGCAHVMDATDLFFMSMARSVKALHPRVQAYVKLQLSALVLTAEMTQQQTQLQQLQQQVSAAAAAAAAASAGASPGGGAGAHAHTPSPPATVAGGGLLGAGAGVLGAGAAAALTALDAAR